jgi:hypothetical protein
VADFQHHRAQAEACLSTLPGTRNPGSRDELIQRAQAHATLALAIATAHGTGLDPEADEEVQP